MEQDAYHFVTQWRVAGRCEEVADLFEDIDRIPQWWRSVYREVRVVRRGGEHALGRIVEVLTKGFLPYSLRWRFEVVEVHYPYNSRIVATGDVEGDGRWDFVQDADFVNVTYDWRVKANHPFIRRFGRLLRPLFAANHNSTMRDGLRGLRSELARLHEKPAGVNSSGL